MRNSHSNTPQFNDVYHPDIFELFTITSISDVGETSVKVVLVMAAQQFADPGHVDSLPRRSFVTAEMCDPNTLWRFFPGLDDRWAVQGKLCHQVCVWHFNPRVQPVVR